jgi:hypothetical protein
MTAEQHRSLVDRFDQADGRIPGAGPRHEEFDGWGEGEREAEGALLELAVDAIRLSAIAAQVKAAKVEYELTSVSVFTVKQGGYQFCMSS